MYEYSLVAARQSATILQWLSDQGALCKKNPKNLLGLNQIHGQLTFSSNILLLPRKLPVHYGDHAVHRQGNVFAG